MPELSLREKVKRHPIPISAHFSHSLVLTYALEPEILEPLLPPGLVLDTYRGFGFLAIALVQTRQLRPSFLPCGIGPKLLSQRVSDLHAVGRRRGIVAGVAHSAQRYGSALDGVGRQLADPLQLSALPGEGGETQAGDWLVDRDAAGRGRP